MPRRTPQPANSNDPGAAEPASELRRLIDDMGRRIARQQKRVEKILVNRQGPPEEAQALLENLIKARELMQAQLDELDRP